MADLPTELTQDIPVVELDRRGIGSQTFLQKFNALIRYLKALVAEDGTLGNLTSAWTAYTPVVTATSGTITTYTATGKYKTVGKTTFVQMSIVITTNGTGSGTILSTVPVAAAASAVLTGREITSSGHILQGFITATGTSVIVSKYDNSYPAASGRTLVVSGVYENT